MTKTTAGVSEKPITFKPDVTALAAESSIKGSILRQMGMPKGYIKMRIVNVFGKTYRVNVFAEKRDSTAVVKENAIIESFFLKIDDNHEIVSCDPPIPQNKYS